MPEFVFTLQDLRKVVGLDRVLIEDLTLAFLPGAKIGVVGANGTGKSTLLRIMAGVDKEFVGEARPAPATLAGMATADGVPRQNPALPLGQPVRSLLPLYQRLHSQTALTPNRVAEPRRDAASTSLDLGTALAQLGGIYVLAEVDDGLVIVDMHAAHERITYEAMKREFAADRLVAEPLLLPVEIRLAEREADAVGHDTGGIPDVSDLPAPVRAIFESAFGDATGHIFLVALPFAVGALVAVLFIREVPLRTSVKREDELMAEAPRA